MKTQKKAKPRPSPNNKKINSGLILAIILILISFGVSIYFYNYLPEKLATHWGLNGEANGFTDKFWGAFLLPAITTILALILYFIPSIDPLLKNVKEFRETYNQFIAVFCGFMLYVHSITISINLGLNLNIGQLLSPAFGLLMIGIAHLLSKAKRNYFIGIRTPWTLNSEENWNKTHKVGAKALKIAGLICFLGLLLPGYAFVFILAPIIIATIYSVAYSYFEYTKEKK